MNEQIADPKQSHNAIQHNIDPVLITDSLVRCQSTPRIKKLQDPHDVTCNLVLVKTRYLQLGNRKVAKMYQISIFIFTFDFFQYYYFKKTELVKWY